MRLDQSCVQPCPLVFLSLKHSQDGIDGICGSPARYRYDATDTSTSVVRLVVKIEDLIVEFLLGVQLAVLVDNGRLERVLIGYLHRVLSPVGRYPFDPSHVFRENDARVLVLERLPFVPHPLNLHCCEMKKS